MRKLKIFVIIGGCGHGGLPLGIVFADRGLDVVLLDRDQAKIGTLNAGQMPFMEANALEQLGRVVGKKLFCGRALLTERHAAAVGVLRQHLGQIRKMLELYRAGSHIVVGSRYMKVGRLLGGPWFKQLLSRLSGLTLCWFRGIPTHNASNAFKIYDSAMLSDIRIESKGGFELSLEITVKAFLAGYKITETPSTWREGTVGASRFRLWKWLPHYLKWYFMAFQPRSKSRGSRKELQPT